MRYARTKLCNLLFARELEDRIGSRGVTVVALHPGIVASDIFEDIPTMGQFFNFLSPIFAISTSKAASWVLRAALDPELEGKRRQFYMRDKQSTPSVRWCLYPSRVSLACTH